MLRPQNTNIPLDLDFRVGLGWMLGGLGDIDIRNGGPVAHHAGATLLFHGQGEYEIANPGEDAVLPEKVRLRADGGVLFVEYSIPVLFPGTASFAVAPVSETEAIIRGIGRGLASVHP